MIYFVTKQTELFDNINYMILPMEKSLKMIDSWGESFQFDTETNGRDSHINKLLLAQFGDTQNDTQVVVDCTTIDILNYKKLLESKYIIGQNLKFDLQFLYNYNIIPRKVYDTMIVEQLLYLGYPSIIEDNINGINYSLKAIAKRYLNIDIDKTVRGEIIWRGIDTSVIIYAAGDVKYLGKIKNIQIDECKKKSCIKAAKLECDFVPVIAYLEWCGIKLDVDKWKIKMKKDLEDLSIAKKELDSFVISNPLLSEFTFIDRQGDLFTGFDLTPKCTINWSSSSQVIQVAKILGFDTKVVDKKTGEEKDSVIEKQLKKQKGINDEFLKLYLGHGESGDDDFFIGYQGAAKLVTSFGQGHLNAINPITGRIHTSYKQLGADTGRMSSGSKQNNNDLAKFKKLPINPSSKQKKEGLGCPYPNMQQLPSDDYTRSCFIAESNNLWVSCDYSAIESRLGADIYKEQSMIDEYLHGSGDIHSLVAKMVFDELKDIPIKDIKKKFPHLRKLAKPIEFSQQFKK